MVQGIYYYRFFPIHRLGEDVAFKAAKAYRDQLYKDHSIFIDDVG